MMENLSRQLIARAEKSGSKKSLKHYMIEDPAYPSQEKAEGSVVHEVLMSEEVVIEREQEEDVD